jgi:hypothetical protein
LRSPFPFAPCDPAGGQGQYCLFTRIHAPAPRETVEQRAANYLAMIHIGMILLWL